MFDDMAGTSLVRSALGVPDTIVKGRGTGFEWTDKSKIPDAGMGTS